MELAPGESIQVRVAADAGQLDIPGDYTAELTFTTDAPYVNAPTTVRLHVTAPASWGEVSGTVTAGGSGTALPGATVQICAVHGMKKASAATRCTPWRPTLTALMRCGCRAARHLDVVAVADGYTARTKEVVVRKGSATVADFALAEVLIQRLGSPDP